MDEQHLEAARERVERLHDSVEPDGLATLAYRYFCFESLIEPLSGDVYQRHLQRKACSERMTRWMPHFVRVHAWICAMLVGLIATAAALQLSAWCWFLPLVTLTPQACYLSLVLVVWRGGYAAREEQSRARDRRWGST